MHLESFSCRVWTVISVSFLACTIVNRRGGGGGGGGGGGVDALLCPVCDPLRCTLPECRGSVIMDRCNCCYECARTTNETCGGHSRMEGMCDEGLVCVISPALGSEISNSEVGVCKEIGSAASSAETPSCNDVICDVPVTPLCPADSSSVVVGNSRSHKCCPTPPSCNCKPCPTGDHASCPPGFVRILKFEGSRRPGNCCDIYECIEHARFCDHVPCDAYLFSNSCPNDSVPLSVAPTLPEDSCCPTVQNSCACKPKSECSVQDCPPGLQKRLRKLATGFPGSCCNQSDCINGSNPVCSHNGTIRFDGEAWKQGDCITCTCQKGLTVCVPMECPSLTRCSWMGIPQGECCPICRGCVSQSGDLYLSGATWEQDSCVTCHCDEGQVYCQAQLCAITCSNPRTIPGQCCPECDEDASSVTIAVHCPVLSKCKLMCQNGYLKGPDGCYKCQCDEVTEEPCDIDCPHGYRFDIVGFEVCDCADPPPLTSVPKTMHSVSTSSLPALMVAPPICPKMLGCAKQCSYGYRKDKTGCPRCRCNKCPLVGNCTKKCANGFVYNVDACRLCKCLDSESSDVVTSRLPVDARRCISVDGDQLEEGQVWWDGCRKCFCHQGQEMCALVACPAVRCANPLMRPGSCCPSCGGEVSPPMSAGGNMCHSSNGRHYVEGETWQLDDCTQCICHQGSALCTIESCPPTLCHQPIIMPHSCCPVCPDKNGFLPSVVWKVNPLRSCRSVGGTHYSSGDTWQVNACQSCTCHDGQIHCFSQTCPILRCNKTFLKKNQCCPMCMDNSAKYCSYGGNIYSANETWLVDDCTRCICSAEGQVLCMVTVCEVPKCQAPVSSVGSCCAVCPNITESSGGDNGHLSGTNVAGPDKEIEARMLFNRTLIALLSIVALLVFVIILLLVLLLRRRSRKECTIYSKGSKSPSASPFSYVSGSTLCAKPTNLDYKIQNPTSISSGTASSKLLSSDHSLKMQPSVLSCNETKPSSSDESLLDNSFQLGCTTSSDDSIKVAQPHASPMALDLEVSAFSAMDRLRMKRINRRSAGDELEQTRHLLTATPSLGVTNNNRKSW